jgi:hypothetical protein
VKKKDVTKLIVKEVLAEVYRATKSYPPFHSAHEGYALLLEEADELWDEVKVKQAERSIDAMKLEAIQVAAMALRFVHDCCYSNGKGYGK